MKISYSFVTDWDFYRIAFAHQLRQRPGRLRNIIISTGVIAVFIYAWTIGRSTSATWTPIAACGAIGGLVGGVTAHLLTRITTPMRIKRLPNYGGTVTVVLDDVDLHADEAGAQITLVWPAFTHVTRFADGLLLTRGRVSRWLPDAALQSGTPHEALALVQSKSEVGFVG